MCVMKGSEEKHICTISWLIESNVPLWSDMALYWKYFSSMFDTSNCQTSFWNVRGENMKLCIDFNIMSDKNNIWQHMAS